MTAALKKAFHHIAVLILKAVIWCPGSPVQRIAMLFRRKG